LNCIFENEGILISECIDYNNWKIDFLPY
jgi:hypothetical protein